jgi:Chorismate synthase
MSSQYGTKLRISIFGQSHSPAIGVSVDGLPAGIKIDKNELRAFLKRRAPGQSDVSTARTEDDAPEILSGLAGGVTCGAPLAIIIRNEDARSADYRELRDIPRPSHADYAAHIKYGGHQDVAGGGHFSGRLTAPLCAAGGICLQILRGLGIHVGAHILRIASVEDIREIFSHEQAIQQCAGYLKGFGKGVKITTVANTAEAAKMVAESDRNDIAALSSRACCDLYNLKCVESSVQDRGNNYTRFICISKNLEIYPGADRTSIMLTTAHKPGSLYKVLGQIFTLGVNIVKLESRPIPDRDFEFMFI